MYYTYRDLDYIITQFKNDFKSTISNTIKKIEELQILSLEPLKFERSKELPLPSTFYLHLTYRCNLKCSYCYNRNIRVNNQDELSFDKWKIILNKILPTATQIVLTGGECLLYKDILKIVEYIKLHNSKIRVSVISNCMHDFPGRYDNLLSLIDSIDFSCDSISKVGERIGFKPELFQRNIKWIREKYPHLQITIASTITKENENENSEISNFCLSHKCQLSKNILIPETPEDIENMPDIFNQHDIVLSEPGQKQITKLPGARIRCSAGIETWSIDPKGDVFPCQSLHYDNLNLGNIITSSIQDIISNRKAILKMPTVDKIPVCSNCNVRYLCGGGCLATGYNLNNKNFDRNHLTCYLSRAHSIAKLRNLNNRLDKETNQ